MKDTLLLFLVVMGLFPILILDKLTQNKLPESSNATDSGCAVNLK